MATERLLQALAPEDAGEAAHILALLELQGVSTAAQLEAAAPDVLRDAGVPEYAVGLLSSAVSPSPVSPSPVSPSPGAPVEPAAGAAAESPAVPFSIEPAEGGQPDEHLVRLTVPAGAAGPMAAHPIYARGSEFRLEQTGSPTELVCRIVSPRPEDMAAVLADRVGRRLLDPNPPGMESCVVS